MTTYRLDIGYDGTGFRGYARNRGVRTVQAEIEAALDTVLGVTPKTSVAGRTDAGVHARHNVVSFPLDEPIGDIGQVRRSLGRMLGPEIAVRRFTAAPDGFDARFSATARSYRYFVDERPVSDPLQRHRVWSVQERLDLDRMNRAAAAFVGLHDFSSLCRKSPSRSPERRIVEAGWHRDRGVLVYAVRASSFCHQLVRSMVAVCVDAGRGKVDPDSVPAIIAARDRHRARGVAPPHGLTLWSVEY